MGGAGADGAGDLIGVHHVSLSVTAIDRSVDWYCQVLGLEVAFTEEAAGRRGAVLRLPASGATVVGLVQHGSGGGAFDPAVTGLDHAAFEVASWEALVEWGRRLDGHGVEHSGAIEIPPGGILNFKDPDGIALALFWNR